MSTSPVVPGTPLPKRMRTDRHNNPTAFTTDVAKNAGLVLGHDYEVGDSFEAGGKTYHTARLLRDPVATTIKVIDKLTFYTKWGQRWTYIGIPQFIWNKLGPADRRDVIKFMYSHEGGSELLKFFVN